MKKKKQRKRIMKSLVAVCLVLCMVMGVLPSGLQVVKPSEVEAAGEPNFYGGAYSTYNPFAWANLYAQCTWYAWGRAYEVTGKSLPCRGNAKTWKDTAQNAGYSVGNVPANNSIAVWGGQYGHVAYVESVNGNMVTLSESNHSKITLKKQYSLAVGISYYSGRSSVTVAQMQNRDGLPLLGYIYLGNTPPSPIVENPVIQLTNDISGAGSQQGKITSARTTTNWACYGLILNPRGSKINRIGIDLFDANNNPMGHYDEAPSANHSRWKNLPIWFFVNGDVKVPLSEGTTYKYQFSADIGGTVIKSEVGSFTTKGNATPATPQLSIAKSDYGISEAIQVNWQKYTNASNFQVTVKGINGTNYNRTITVNNGNAAYSSFTLDKAGEYQVSVVAANATKSSSVATLGTTIKIHPDVTVTFVQDNDGKETLLKTQTLTYGKSATPPAAPSKEGHTFQGWSGSYSNVKQDTKLTATYKRNSYSVKFVDVDSEGKESVLKTETVLYGDSATPPKDPDPKKEGYIFGGWNSNAYQSVSGNCTIKASYVWGNINLPVIAKATECKFEDDVYKVHCTLTNYPNEKTAGRVIVALKTSTGKLLATTESDVFVLGKDATQDLDIIVQYAGAASYAEVVVIDNFSNGIPLSANSSVEVNREWSDWTEEEPTGNVEKEERTEYRTQDKQYTTSQLASLSGWTRYNTTSSWGNYGAWSGWTTTPLSASASRQVETTQEAYQVQTGTLFNYSHWVYRGSNGNLFHTWSQAYAQARGGWYEERGWGGELYLNKLYDGTAWGTSGWPVWFNEWTTPAMETRYRTLYRYRDRSPVTTYHYYKWTDWGDWSTTSATATSDRNVETRTTYRSKAVMSDIDDKTGTERTVSGKVSTEFAGKQATLFVYKHEEASDFNNEFVGQTVIGDDGSYTFTFVTKEEPSQITGDFTIDLAIEGATDPIYLDTIKAPKPVYTVEFVDYDGTVLSTQQVEEGSNATLPDNPTREHCEFTGWNTGITNIHDDMTIMATYEKVKYTVIYVDWEKQEVSFDEYEAGSDLAAPVESTREGYTFKNWLDEEGNVVTKVDKNLVLTAEYQINTYRVKFYDRNGELISDQNVEYGKSALVPEAEEVDNMVFAGWGTNGYVNVKCDVNAYATYSYIYTSDMPKASVESGKYEKDFEVLLTAAPGAVIHYTTDGSTPNEQSPVYTEPITVSKNTVLRYMAQEENKNTSEVGSQVYLITANEDTQGALTIKNNVLNMKVEDEEPIALSYFLSHSDSGMGVKFYSIDEEIATVDAEGKVKGQHVGKTTIFAITDDFKYASACNVTVTTDIVEVESITLDRHLASMLTGNTLSIAAEVYPKTATYQNVLWFSSNPDVATVDAEGNIEAMQEGVACVTAYSYTGNCYINCTVEVQASGLSVAEENIDMEIGGTYKIQAKYDGKDISEGLTWKSSKPDVAAVKNGMVSALSEGTTVITCMNESGEVATVIVNVYKVGELPERPPVSGDVKGDVDANGRLELSDAYLALKFALHAETPNEKQKNIADIDGNGTVELTDVQKLLRAAMKMEQLR